jgi:hypothetical protein
MSLDSVLNTDHLEMGVALDPIEGRIWFRPWDEGFTLMCWFKLLVDDDAASRILSFGGSGPGEDDLVRINIHSDGTQIVTAAESGNTLTGVHLVVGEWTHLCIAYSNALEDAPIFYSNFVKVGDDFLGLPTGGATETLMVLGNTSGAGPTGRIAELKYWPFDITRFGFGGINSSLRAEAFTKGPRAQPRQCMYFSFDASNTRFEGFEGARWISNRAGARFNETGTTFTFSGDDPPGLLPGGFLQRAMGQHNTPPDADTVFPRVRRVVQRVT